MKPAPRLSVVVPVTREDIDLVQAHTRYKAALASLGEIEFLYVLDGELPTAGEALKVLRRRGEQVEILSFGRAFGEAAALTVGLRHARGEIVLTLPPVPEIEDTELPRLVDALDDSTDMVVARRSDPANPIEGRLEAALRFLVKSPFRDIRCRVRAMRRRVAEELVLYGSQERFLPLLAQAQGFKVVELALPMAPGTGLRRQLGIEPTLVLDALTVVFLLRFLKKPFRFFGGIGLAVLAAGALATAWLVFTRLFLGVPLADRPALILSTLLVVLGIQIIAVGLIGEIITFAHAREIDDYKIDRIVE